MMIEQADELVQRIDSLNEKEKKAIIKYVWVKYVLGLTDSDNTDNEIIRTIEEMEENRNVIIKHIYMKYILPELNVDR